MPNHCETFLMWGWCGECYENRRKRANRKGHAYYVRPRRPYVLRPWEMTVKRDVRSAETGSENGKPLPGSLLSQQTELWCHLTDDAWDDGTARTRSTLMLTCDGAQVKLWLHDRAMSRSCWIAGDSVDAALEALECALHDGTLAWRTDRKEVPRKAGK